MKRNLRVVQQPARCATAVAALLVAIGLAGCDQDDIHAYTAPVDPPRPDLVVAADESTPPSLTWQMPDDWRPSANPPRFVLAAYDAGEPGAAAQTTVSFLDGAGGGALANINRWRDQIGLPPVNDLPQQPITPMDIEGDVAAMVDLHADDVRVLGVIYPRQDLDETWFFKMTGPPDTVETHKQAFINLVLSTRPASPASETPSTEDRP